MLAAQPGFEVALDIRPVDGFNQLSGWRDIAMSEVSELDDCRAGCVGLLVEGL